MKASKPVELITAKQGARVGCEILTFAPQSQDPCFLAVGETMTRLLLRKFIDFSIERCCLLSLSPSLQQNILLPCGAGCFWMLLLVIGRCILWAWTHLHFFYYRIWSLHRSDTTMNSMTRWNYVNPQMVAIVDEYYELSADRQGQRSMTKDGIYDVQFSTQCVSF